MLMLRTITNLQNYTIIKWLISLLRRLFVGNTRLSPMNSLLIHNVFLIFSVSLVYLINIFYLGDSYQISLTAESPSYLKTFLSYCGLLNPNDAGNALTTLFLLSFILSSVPLFFIGLPLLFTVFLKIFRYFLILGYILFLIKVFDIPLAMNALVLYDFFSVHHVASLDVYNVIAAAEVSSLRISHLMKDSVYLIFCSDLDLLINKSHADQVTLNEFRTSLYDLYVSHLKTKLVEPSWLTSLSNSLNIAYYSKFTLDFCVIAGGVCSFYETLSSLPNLFLPLQVADASVTTSFIKIVYYSRGTFEFRELSQLFVPKVTTFLREYFFI